MKLVKIQLIIAFLLCSFTYAQDTTNVGVSSYQPLEINLGDSRTLLISGFGDFLATVEGENDSSTFSVNQAEVGFESELTDEFVVTLAIAYIDNNFTIGTFTADYNLYSSGTNNVFGINNLTVGGGQFDVPFGVDYHVYSSIDRKLVSTPLIVESTHNSWNDYGAYLSADASWGNASVYVANGFTHECANPSGEDFEAHNDLSLGSRVGIAPHSIIEIGGSVAYLFGLDQNHDMTLVGGDVQFNYENFELKAEYIAHTFDSDVDANFTNDGYYIQALYNIKNWYIVSRYGEHRPDQKSSDISRLSAGIGHKIGEIAELRFEYQSNKSEKDAGIFQVAFSF